jgi:hypothetical protein
MAVVMQLRAQSSRLCGHVAAKQVSGAHAGGLEIS